MNSLTDTHADFSTHIPDLVKYGERLCGSRTCAERLVADTLESAQKKRWKKAAHVPVDAWLSMLMLRQYMDKAGSS